MYTIYPVSMKSLTDFSVVNPFPKQGRVWFATDPVLDPVISCHATCKTNKPNPDPDLRAHDLAIHLHHFLNIFVLELSL